MEAKRDHTLGELITRGRRMLALLIMAEESNRRGDNLFTGYLLHLFVFWAGWTVYGGTVCSGGSSSNHRIGETLMVARQRLERALQKTHLLDPHIPVQEGVRPKLADEMTQATKHVMVDLLSDRAFASFNLARMLPRPE